MHGCVHSLGGSSGAKICSEDSEVNVSIKISEAASYLHRNVPLLCIYNRASPVCGADVSRGVCNTTSMKHTRKSLIVGTGPSIEEGVVTEG